MKEQVAWSNLKRRKNALQCNKKTYSTFYMFVPDSKKRPTAKLTCTQSDKRITKFRLTEIALN